VGQRGGQNLARPSQSHADASHNATGPVEPCEGGYKDPKIRVKLSVCSSIINRIILSFRSDRSSIVTQIKLR
jgi:hypothetical protein